MGLLLSAQAALDQIWIGYAPLDKIDEGIDCYCSAQEGSPKTVLMTFTFLVRDAKRFLKNTNGFLDYDTCLQLYSTYMCNTMFNSCESCAIVIKRCHETGNGTFDCIESTQSLLKDESVQNNETTIPNSLKEQPETQSLLTDESVQNKMTTIPNSLKEQPGSQSLLKNESVQNKATTIPNSLKEQPGTQLSLKEKHNTGGQSRATPIPYSLKDQPGTQSLLKEKDDPSDQNRATTFPNSLAEQPGTQLLLKEKDGPSDQNRETTISNFIIEQAEPGDQKNSSVVLKRSQRKAQNKKKFGKKDKCPKLPKFKNSFYECEKKNSTKVCVIRCRVGHVHYNGRRRNEIKCEMTGKKRVWKPQDFTDCIEFYHYDRFLDAHFGGQKIPKQDYYYYFPVMDMKDVHKYTHETTKKTGWFFG